MATLIPVNGEKQEIFPVDGKSFTLEEMQALVGGYIEFLYLPDGRIMVINEEGKLTNLTYNFNASLYGVQIGIANDDYIVGPALLCSNIEAGSE
jgi:hypothetical protein